MKGIVFALGLLIAVTGCGGEGGKTPKLTIEQPNISDTQEVKFDGTSDESVKSSIEKMTENLSSDEREEFEKDMIAITWVNFAKDSEIDIEKRTSKTNRYKSLQGLTVTEIRSKAKEIRSKQK